MALLDNALAWAEAGWPVFPCWREGKGPACANGVDDATLDPDRIRELWAADPDFNIGLGLEKAGYGVIDIDSEAGWTNLLAAQGLPEPHTFTVRTPSGGRHLYFAGELPATVGKITQGVDTRGRGSYVVAPPSVAPHGAYVIERDIEPAPVPRWVLPLLQTGAQPAKSAGVALDLPDNVARARKTLEDRMARGAVVAPGRNDEGYRVACELLNIGLSPEAVAPMMDRWNTICSPPLDPAELQHVITSASRYAQNEPGAWAVPGSASEVFSEAVAKLGPAPARRSRFFLEDDDDMDKTPEAKWIIPGILQEGATCMIFGATQSFKSFIALAIALSVATGKPSLGWEPRLTGPTVYAALEGRSDIKRKRRKAWRIAHDVTGTTAFFTVPAPMLVYPEEVDEFVNQLSAKFGNKPPRLIVLDTVSKMMVGLDATRDAPKLVRFCDLLVERFGCAVIAIHHAGHDASRGPRDSSAYQAGFDTVIELTGQRARKIVSLRVLKHKDAEEPDQVFNFQGRLIGPSLVFFPIPAGEAATAREEDDPGANSPKQVGMALRTLKAVGAENAVDTRVLATEMEPQHDGETIENRQAAITKRARALGSAQARLKGYWELVGGRVMWFLPA